MANAAGLRNTLPVRMLVVGYPKAGKTGALASLLDAGFKMRFLDLDGNYDPLLHYTKPEKLANLDIQSFEDPIAMSGGGQFASVIGKPMAYANALMAMDHWKYKDEEGKEVDLGRSKDWGSDTIVVLDSLTALGQAAFNRSMHLQNKTPLTTTDRVWGFAMSEQLAFVKRLMASSNTHHTIVLAHLKMLGPKEIRKGDDSVTQQVKQEVADLLPTRLWPNALGRQLPQEIGGEFPMIVEMKNKIVNRKEKHIITTVAREELDLGVPNSAIPAELDISDGMLKLFEVLSPKSVALVGENDGTL